SGDVTVTGNLDASSLTTSGGSIAIVAGANFFETPGVYVSIQSASLTGGSINLGSATLISTAGGRAAGNGGSINLAAFNAGAGTGIIFLPGLVTVTTGGSGTGNNGSVIIVGDGSTLQIGPLNVTGGSGTPGSINISTST